MNFDLEAATVLRVLHGSWAYGTNIEGSDRDEKGVAIPPLRYFVGFSERFEQAETKAPDSVIFDIRKMFALASASNPNIIEILSVPDECVLKSTPIGDSLRALAPSFLSKRAVVAFCGYAQSQIKRIRTHRSWLLNPPKGLPLRTDFGLPESGKPIAADMMGGIEKLLAEGASFSGEVLELVEREKRYARAVDHWKSFQNWEKTRNKLRADTEKQFGYDTKHAMHLVRLLRMCSEILAGNGVIVRRPDAEELIAIRRGAWSYDELIEWAEKQDAAVREAEETSHLRAKPDMAYLDRCCTSMVLNFHWGSRVL